MRRILFSLLLITLPLTIVLPQVSVLKQVKATFKNGDVSTLEKHINKALLDSVTMKMAETWNYAGRIQQKKSAVQMEKAYLRKPYDTLTIYNCALNMSKYFLICDSLAQQEMKPGKINKYRKDSQKAIVTDKGNLLNGGIYFYNQAGEGDTEKLSRSLDFFKTYIDLTLSDMFKDAGLLNKDSVFTQVAYYASLAAFRIGDYGNVLKYAPYAEDDPKYGQYALEFMSQAYISRQDTENWLATLERGIEKYPQDDFFFANLIDYYGTNQKYDEALEFADGMLAKNPGNYFYLYVKGYLYQNMKNYVDALTYYKKAIESNPEHAESYSNVGLVYCLQAQDFSQEAVTDINDPRYSVDQAQLKSYYEKALPYYEKARELKPNTKSLWLNGLHRVYYNLNMGEKFKEVDALVNSK